MPLHPKFSLKSILRGRSMKHRRQFHNHSQPTCHPVIWISQKRTKREEQRAQNEKPQCKANKDTWNQDMKEEKKRKKKSMLRFSILIDSHFATISQNLIVFPSPHCVSILFLCYSLCFPLFFLFLFPPPVDIFSFSQFP